MQPVMAEKFEALWLPRKPLATDVLAEGIHHHSRPAALEMRYLEANAPGLSNLLVVDIDHGDALMRALWGRQSWWPTFIVENPANGHAHAAWALAEPVTRTEYARRKPLALAAAVVEGLRRSVDGDQGYSGLITKNPTHSSWEGTWWSDQLYELNQLADRLHEIGALPPEGWRRSKRRNVIGLGRNCSIFETARTWAYREVRQHFGDSAGLHVAITAHVHELNAEFPEPLNHNEAQDIANSIHRWITTRSRMWADGPATYEATFSTIQAARRRKGGGKSRRASQEKSQEIIREATS